MARCAGRIAILDDFVQTPACIGFYNRIAYSALAILAASPHARGAFTDKKAYSMNSTRPGNVMDS